MKIVLITGASSGLGETFAKQLDRLQELDKDVCFWLVARRTNRLEELEKRLRHPCRLFSLDLSLSESFQTLAEALQKENSQICWLVNGAGLGFYGETASLSPEQIEKTIGINCVALTRLCNLAAPYLVPKGYIVNISSGAAFLPQPGFSVYAASKAYVKNLSMALKRELKSKKIRVCALCPGPVATDFFQGALKPGQTIPEYKKKFMADPEKVVKKAIKDARKNRNVSAYSFSMKLVWLASKIFPWSWILNILY